MKRAIFCSAFLLLIFPAPARQKIAESSKTAHHKKSDATAATCKNLGTLAALIDGAFDGQKNETRMIKSVLTNPDDGIWDELIDCAEATAEPSERAEALRVAAIWERLRAEAFQKAYRDMAVAQPVPAPACKHLDKLRARVKAVTDEEPSSAISHPMRDYDSTLEALEKCMKDSFRVNKGEPDERYWSTVTLVSLELWQARRARAFFEQAYLNTTDYAKAQAEYDAKQNGGAKQNEQPGTDRPLSAGGLAEMASQCDQIITIAGLTPNGLALYIPPEGQKFMAKNAKNYPRMCLLQNAARFVPGVPSYLLVWAYSEGAFAGFQPVTQARTTPVSGSGTVTNGYGNQWNFTYTGTMTEMDTIEAPYVIQSHSLYLNAYDENGNVVSRHSVTTSNQAGGDASYAAGYNAGALISLLWNNPSRLIKSVLKDVQKDSMKYGKK